MEEKGKEREWRERRERKEGKQEEEVKATQTKEIKAKRRRQKMKRRRERENKYRDKRVGRGSERKSEGERRERKGKGTLQHCKFVTRECNCVPKFAVPWQGVSKCDLRLTLFKTFSLVPFLSSRWIHSLHRYGNLNMHAWGKVQAEEKRVERRK